MTPPDRPFDIRPLLRPSAYPWPVDRVELIETHISWVFLAGDRVVKLKRPVDLGFVDFRDPARRKQACEDEVRLNRRLTTDVYLGVVPVTAQGVDAAGEPLEWATLMRRLPAERMLDQMLQGGQAPPDLAKLLAERLIPFHDPRPVAAKGSACPRDPEIYLRVLHDNLDHLEVVAGDLLGPRQRELVAGSMRSFMRTERARLADRFANWLREGHGDLRCEHICLEPAELQIFDCVEFEIAIRCADVASDLAFLLMDLRRLGASDVAAEVLARYRAAGFDLPQQVVDLYAAHRALVRAKVAALERTGTDAARDLRLAFEAAAYLDLATAYACPVRPMSILVSGLSGSGKSTVAAALARSTDGRVIASDRVRKELAGLQPTTSAAAPWHEGIYSDDWTARTYDRMLDLAGATLAAGSTAVLDATFLDNDQRERFVDMARNRGVPSMIVWVEADDAVVRRRIDARARAGGSPSDATVAIRERQIDGLRRSPVQIPDGTLAATVDTTRDGPPQIDAVVATIDAAGLMDRLGRRPEGNDA